VELCSAGQPGRLSDISVLARHSCVASHPFAQTAKEWGTLGLILPV